MIRVSLVLLVGLLATLFMRRRSAALRHWVLAAAVVCASAIPLVQRVTPTWQMPLPRWIASAPTPSSATGRESQAVLVSDDANGTAASFAVAGPALTNAVTFERIWLIGSLVGVMCLLVGFTRLVRLTATSRPVVDGPWMEMAAALADPQSSRPRIRLLQSDHPALLVTWGLLRPKVILPVAASQWPPAQVRAVLSHELAHVARRDWTIQMLAEALRCLYWFNPLLWIVCRRLRQESEQACDDAVVYAGMDAPEYAAHLVEVARAFKHTQTTRSLFPAPAMARPSDLERRVRIMLNIHVSRAPLSKLATVAVALGLCVVTVSVAGVTAAPATTASASSGTGDVVRTAASAPGDQALPSDLQAEPARDVPTIRAEAVPAAEARVPVPSVAVATPVATPVAEQAPQGECVGTFTDATGRPMPNVSVSLVNAETSQKFEAKTDENGRFTIGSLANGRYQIEVRKPGFRTLKVEMALADGKTMTLDGVLPIGSLQETVVVSSGNRLAAPEVTGRPTVVVVQRRPGPPAADPCAQSTAGGCVTPPSKLADAKPAFPAEHAAAGVSGQVVITALIGTDGAIKDPRTNDGADPAFAAAALEAVRQWQFSPVKLNGILQECSISVTVIFQAGGN
jgi:TonB family protein